MASPTNSQDCLVVQKWKMVVVAILFGVSTLWLTLSSYQSSMASGRCASLHFSCDATSQQPPPDTGVGRYDVSSDKATQQCTIDAPREKARRRVDRMAAEERNFLEIKIHLLRKAMSSNSAAILMIDQLRTELQGYHQTLRDDLNTLRHVGGDEDWRLAESRRLGELVQRRLDFLQNPKDCGNARLIVCDLNQNCGLGCQVHHATLCLMVAYATNRTLVLQDKKLRYTAQGLSAFFLPLSNTCKEFTGSTVDWNAQVDVKVKEAARALYVGLNIGFRPEYMPAAVPEDLAPRLSSFHGDAPVWWIGQFVRYVTRPNSEMQKYIEEATAKLGFQHPIVGLHVRRTDKITENEAKSYQLEEYMSHAEAYFQQLEHGQHGVKRRVYLATDEPNLLTEARKKYPDYTFITDNSVSRAASGSSRYTKESMRGIILDIHFLSLTDLLVCTFSSNVGRMAFELMQTTRPDASEDFRSLDFAFFFHGENDRHQRAIQKHSPRDDSELAFEVGDHIMPIWGFSSDGMSMMGKNLRTGKKGMYPTYKAVKEFDTAKMPTYPEVSERNAVNKL